MPDEPHSLVAPYALDGLNDQEERDFEEHLALCERCRQELAGLREAAAALAYGAAGPAPPPELKQRILAQAQAQAERENVVPLARSRRNWTAPLAAAAAIAACAALGLGIWAATLKSDLDAARSKARRNELAAVLIQPGAKLVPLSGGGKLAYAPSGSATLVVEAPRAPTGKTYEAWVIQSGKVTKAGLFDGGTSPAVIRITRPVHRGAVVAVTLERAGGVDQPTQKPLMATRTLS
jgi:anti-sigma-K factor RskA